MAESLCCYVPLDRASRNIRLLHLSPEPHPLDNRIQCSLVVAALDSASYEALSYTWGQSDNFDFRIWVNDIHVPVRKNLLCALRALRANGHRVLWIDALCINQNDVVERGHQVEMMGDIYRNASCVLSWLGTPDALERNDSKLDTSSKEPIHIPVLAFDLLECVAKEVEAIWPARSWSTRRSGPRLLYNGGEITMRATETLVPILDKLGDLYFEEYWNRVWIIQEVCLAKTLRILYGRRMIEWNTFHVFKEISSQAQATGTDPSAHHEWGADTYIQASQPWKLEGIRMERLSMKASEGTMLEALLELSRNCICHNRLNNIYGILGLADDTCRELIFVDYTQSLHQLYVNVMKVYSMRVSDSGSILWFNNLLQRSLLFTNPERSTFTSLSKDRNMADHMVNEKDQIELLGTSLGKLVIVSTNPRWIIDDARRMWNYPRQDDEPTETNREKAWERAMEQLWNDDKYLFSCFSYHTAPSEAGHKKSRRIKEENQDIAIFITDTGFVGFGPRGVSAGDILWATSKPYKVFCILTSSNPQLNVKGKELVAHSQIVLKKPTVPLDKHVLHLPYPHFDYEILEGWKSSFPGD